MADKLAPTDISADIARQMRRFAAEQGHDRAAVMVGIHFKDEGKYQEPLQMFQIAVASGYSSSAFRLSKAFRNPPPSNELYLGQQEGLERADHYEKIGNVLTNYSYANPTAPEIDEILPYHPPNCPHGIANIPPQKPSETLIQQLAKGKSLDSATGRPLPDSPAFIRATYPSQLARAAKPARRPATGKPNRSTIFSRASMVSLSAVSNSAR